MFAEQGRDLIEQVKELNETKQQQGAKIFGLNQNIADLEKKVKLLAEHTASAVTEDGTSP